MNTETRPATFEDALREIESGSTPMDSAIMTSLLGDMQMRYARMMSDYKTLRNYALQLNAQCDELTKKNEQLESDLAHAEGKDADSDAAV